MSSKKRDQHGSKKRKWLGTMELAEKLGVHPFSIPRLVKKPGFPKPVKLFSNRNLWDEEVIDAYVETLIAEQAESKAS